MSRPRPVVIRRGTVTICALTLTAGVGISTVLVGSAASALTRPSVAPGSVALPSLSLPSVSLPSVSLSASPLPSVSAPALPLPSVSLPSSPLPSVSVPPVSVSSGSVPPVSVPSVPLPVPLSTTPAPGLPSVPGVPSVQAPVGSVVSGVQSGVGGVTSRLPGVAGLSGGSAGSVLGVGVNASPIATACVQAKGTGTALANVTVTVGGHNITAPLVQALPGILAPCPAGATPASPGVGASAGGGLVGACVKATSQAPVNASVLVLDTELVGELTKAGVPLQQLVVPCPKGLTGGGSGSGAGGSGGGGSAGASGGPSAAGSAARSGAPAGRAAASGGNGQGGSASSCGNGSRGWSNLNAETLASVIPSNIPQTLPWILLALALLGRRRLSVAVAHVRAFRGSRRTRLPA